MNCHDTVDAQMMQLFLFVSELFSYIISVSTSVRLETVVGACSQDRTSASRSKGLQFHFYYWSCVEVSGKLYIHTLSDHPATVGTWCINPRLDQ